MTNQKVKKEHYVPQFYLNAWDEAGTHQIHVYDKTADCFRVNNISDVAVERYFYDVNPKDIFSKKYLDEMKKHGFSWDSDEKSQGLELFLSKEIEKPMSNLINGIIEKARSITPWHIDNCFFISEEKKLELSIYLAIQFIRTRHIRTGIIDNADCIVQWLEDMGVPDLKVKEYTISKEAAKNMHIQMLIDKENLEKVTNCFFRLTWMLGINRTEDKLFTSDNPIGTQAHIKDPILSMNGIGSRGVEVFYPFSPDIILIMADATYHTHCQAYERGYVELLDTENIDYYNSILAMQAERYVFSSDGNMSIIEEMKHEAPDVFKQPHVQMKWGEKTITPRR